VAETVLALEYLHMMGVVYRDLKPENVLVRGDGHIMLSDFDLSLKCDVVPRLLRHNSLPHNASGAAGRADAAKPSCVPPIQPVLSCLFKGVHKCQQAKEEAAPSVSAGSGGDGETSSSEPAAADNNSNPEVVVEPVSARSKSFVGTHEYLAPEVISGQGHGSAVDWWTLGVFMYEMIYGRTPFKGESNDKTLANIIKQPLAFPRVGAAAATGKEWDEHLRAQDLMSQLLAKNPKKRLGGSTGSAEVKRHDFFKGVNWALVRSVRPPEVPKPAPAVAVAQAAGALNKKVVMMSRKQRQEPYSPVVRADERFEYF
jgi:serine/threonine protein kinase